MNKRYEDLVTVHLHLVEQVARLKERLRELENRDIPQTPAGQQVTGRGVNG